MSGDKPRAWVIGAGLAGLSAAVRLTKQGWAVTIFESAGQEGGRCRSFHDTQLDRRIDNDHDGDFHHDNDRGFVHDDHHGRVHHHDNAGRHDHDDDDHNGAVRGRR